MVKRKSTKEIVMSATNSVDDAIRCALEVYDKPDWTQWAEAWLSGQDRSVRAALAAAEVAEEDAKAYDVSLYGRAAAGDAHDAACIAARVAETAESAVTTN
jgi:hypothetical protein